MDYKIVLEKNECEEGSCPVCNSEKLEYGYSEVVDNVVLYPWACSTCGAEGKEVAVTEFIGHDIDRDALPPQVDDLYANGGMRPERITRQEEQRIQHRPREKAPLTMHFAGSDQNIHALGLPTSEALLSKTLDATGISGEKRNSWCAYNFSCDPERISPETLDGVFEQVNLENIDEVNYLAALLEKLEPADCGKLDALAETGLYLGNPADFINLILNLDIYEHIPEATSPQAYARYLSGGDDDTAKVILEQMFCEGASLHGVIRHGEFTAHGYVRNAVRRFEAFYDGKNVPEQYRVSSSVVPPPNREPPKKKRDDIAR